MSTLRRSRSRSTKKDSKDLTQRIDSFTNKIVFRVAICPVTIEKLSDYCSLVV